ncbi:MAG: excinuclease [Shewanella sp.]|nr:excinuclease [Shewanella sp.]MCF1429833.1 excinuclease [Shewanella sp.]MCF1458205.1 excinuclease [Shewanella sp.]
MMKKLSVLSLLSLALLAAPSFARDEIGNYTIADAMALPVAQSKLGHDVTFYFGNQAHPEVEKALSEIKTNKKTNAFNKSDEEACQWVFLSAMLELKNRAIKEGGNAVINIKSNYRNNLTTSEETFQCGAGTLVAGVALTGEIVKLKQ